MTDVMLTTSDNPYSPFTQFEQWNAFDTQHGYNTLSYLARVTYTSDNLSEEERQLAIDAAIDEIIDFDVFGIYELVVEPVSGK